MTALDYYKKVLNQYADITGRARRSEYWYYTLINFSIYLVLVLLTSLTTEYFAILIVIYALGVLVPTFCVAVRRLHDSGKSGTYLLFSLIPAIGGIIVLVFMCMDSETGTNKWGPNPKEISTDFTNVSEHLV